MRKEIDAMYLDNCTTDTFEIESVRICPICRTSHAGNYLKAYIIRNCAQHYGVVHNLYAIHFCDACEGIFISKHTSQSPHGVHPNFNLERTIPQKQFIEKDFDGRIRSISPRFVEVYNQANQAEAEQLDEISGMGYRKALECLIKDYLISTGKYEKEKVVNSPLGTCIDNMIQNEQVKRVARKCAWIGNDFTHYESKHNLGIETLKSLIEAVVYWVCMELVSAEADLISSK